MLLWGWLTGFLPGEVWAACAELVCVPVGALCGSARHVFRPPEIPRVGWMKVCPVLKEFAGPPGCFAAGVPVSCHRGLGTRLCPVQCEPVLWGRMQAPRFSTVPSELAPPGWG